MGDTTKLFYNKRNRKTYAQQGTKFFEHIDKHRWKETLPKAPMRSLPRPIYDCLYLSFELFKDNEHLVNTHVLE